MAQSTNLTDRPKRQSAHAHDYKRLNEMGKLDDTMDVIKEAFSPNELISGSGGAATGGKFGGNNRAPSVEEMENEEMAEINALKLEISRAEEEKRLLLLRQEKERLRAQLEKTAKEVSYIKKEGISEIATSKLSFPAVSYSGQFQSEAKKPETDKTFLDSVTLKDLRQDKKLRKHVAKHLRSVGLADSETGESDLESSDDESEAESVDKLLHKFGLHVQQTDSSSKSKKKSKKSGINATAADKVIFPQRWPHANLQYEYVNKAVQFENLNFKLFVAGELEIISDDGISKEERKGRLSLLKKIVYYASTYTFEGLRTFYAAVVRQIELGLKTWGEDNQQIEQAILTKYLLRNETSTKKPSKNFGFETKKENSTSEAVWFCAYYNRNKCSSTGDHFDMVKGKVRHCLHICAECWLRDRKKVKHQESSKECPHSTQ